MQISHSRRLNVPCPQVCTLSMPPATNTDVLKVYKEVQNGKSLKRAWEDNGQPGTWGNVQRQYQKLYQAPTPAAAAAGSSSRKRSRATAETPREQPVRAAAAPSAAARSGATTSRKQPASSEPEREGPAIGKRVRRMSVAHAGDRSGSGHGAFRTTGSDFQHLGIRQTIRGHLISSAGHMGVHVAPTP